jgi:hypothetical protein
MSVTRAEIIAPGKLTRREWAKRINDQWRGAAAGMLGAIFQIGHDLNAAKKDLGHGQFMLMVKHNLKFSREERSNYRIANMFMRVADDRRLSNVKTLSHLPPYYATLYKITRLEDDVFERLLSDGIIRPAVTYAEINKVLRTEKVKADEQRVLNLAPIVGFAHSFSTQPGNTKHSRLLVVPSRAMRCRPPLGIEVGQTTVANYMAERRRPPSQGWKTFLHNHADGIASMDLFVVPTISFRLLYRSSASGSRATPPSSPCSRSAAGSNAWDECAIRMRANSRSPPTAAARMARGCGSGSSNCKSWPTTPAS